MASEIWFRSYWVIEKICFEFSSEIFSDLLWNFHILNFVYFVCSQFLFSYSWPIIFILLRGNYSVTKWWDGGKERRGSAEVSKVLKTVENISVTCTLVICYFSNLGCLIECHIIMSVIVNVMTAYHNLYFCH